MRKNVSKTQRLYKKEYTCLHIHMYIYVYMHTHIKIKLCKHAKYPQEEITACPFIRQ